MTSKGEVSGSPHRTPAFVIHPFSKTGTNIGRSAASRLDEAVGLASAIDLNVISKEALPIRKIQTATYFGKGTVERLSKMVEAHKVSVICVDNSLSAVQQRNLEIILNVKVIDRTGLILEIFGDRAVTREGVLQVELAHLIYQRSRLVRTWTHLERQRGGFGFLGGPGETQIEADRRIISDRITKIRRELETVTRTRMLHRKARARVPYPVVALVGYTNAGKSSLFNALTNANVVAKDLLFATLDPKMRELGLPSRRSIILSDTVGFVSELPTPLIAAFRATLEEVIAADIIVHVRDISHPDTEVQKQDVIKVLGELGVNLHEGNKFVEVLNKIDLLTEGDKTVLQNIGLRNEHFIPLSAKTGENTQNFIREIDELLSADSELVTLRLPHGKGEEIAWLYRNSAVLERVYKEDCVEFHITISPGKLSWFEKKYLRN